jgi:hypothetical protein
VLEAGGGGLLRVVASPGALMRYVMNCTVLIQYGELSLIRLTQDSVPAVSLS